MRTTNLRRTLAILAIIAISAVKCEEVLNLTNNREENSVELVGGAATHGNLRFLQQDPCEDWWPQGEYAPCSPEIIKALPCYCGKGMKCLDFFCIFE